MENIIKRDSFLRLNYCIVWKYVFFVNIERVNFSINCIMFVLFFFNNLGCNNNFVMVFCIFLKKDFLFNYKLIVIVLYNIKC